ncbi:hypothetical protein L1987_70136 [Smallanthus sonchifolius]|uniref:Uncharacterized protein n=1 Tax=Smallanthus sonchifolius TaxID=185202 RepID=A0ACB9AP21_9ASTR|nr:hypothetical protein L1987_70136 [Smallanthus sonchifolius]
MPYIYIYTPHISIPSYQSSTSLKMEMEHMNTPLMSKKLWRILRAILYMLKKNLSKNIPWFELHMVLKRSTKLAGKAIGNLLLDHHTLSCRPSNIHTTFIAPVEYEFSCSDTPLFYAKRKTHRRSHKDDHKMVIHNVKKVFEILNDYESVEPEKSPLTELGLGESRNVRQLRVTDSPFPEDNTEEDSLQVDKKAEEFIKNFYKELKQQKKRAAVEPPSPPSVYRKWGKVR